MEWYKRGTCHGLLRDMLFVYLLEAVLGVEGRCRRETACASKLREEREHPLLHALQVMFAGALGRGNG